MLQERTIRMLSLGFFGSLLTWGIYTLVVYLGVPVHDAVLTSGEAQARLGEVCESGSVLCRGVTAFFPFLWLALERAAPFAWYAGTVIVLYALLVSGNALRTGMLTFQWTMKPWKVLALFLFTLWLLFTTLSFGKAGEYPFRMFFEPTEKVYQGVGEEGMMELRANYESLQRRGCLTHIGSTQNGAQVFMLRTACVQASFLSRVLPQFLFVMIFLFELLVLGRALLRLLGVKPEEVFLEAILASAIGACGWIAILWTTAVASAFLAPVGWFLALGVPVLLYRHSLYWLRKFFRASWTCEWSWSDPRLLVAMLLLTYIALNFLNVLRPFPIGWDDLGSYLNRPRLLVSYGHFVFSMATFQWEYLTAMGFLLFGFDSFFGATASMMINWAAGLLAIGVLIAFAQHFLGRGRGLLAALLYYSLPLVGHFSYADMKIDNAVFMMGSLSLFAIFLHLFPRSDDQSVTDGISEQRYAYLVLAGIFGAFAFGMKPTSTMVLTAVGAILVGARIQWSGFLGAALFVVALFGWKGILNIRGILVRILGTDIASAKSIVLSALLVLGAGFLFHAFRRHRSAFMQVLREGAVFAAVFLAGIAPWFLHNNVLAGNLIPKFETGAPNTLTPMLVLSGTRDSVSDHGQDIRVIPPDIALDINHPTCTPTGTKEELDRYWGFERGWRHYVTLPWRTVMNINATGYYVTTMPALLLFPLLLLLPFFWTARGRWLRWLFVGTLFILLQWMFLANGIPWYGLGMFLGLSLGLEAMVAHAPDPQSRWLMAILLTLSLFVTFSNRLWQFDQQKNLFEYAFGKINATALRERTIPHYDDIAAVIVERHMSIPDRPYTYRVGTFIPYFVPRSLEVIGIADHQLDTFNCLYQERDPELTLKRIKALGFSSIIFDTNTATIEEDIHGTLHTKVQSFVDFLNNPKLGFQMLVNDSDAGVAFLLIP